jgi:hypothetical protein
LDEQGDTPPAAAVRALDQYIHGLKVSAKVASDDSLRRNGVPVVLGGQPWLLRRRGGMLGLIATPGEFVGDVVTYDHGNEDEITERWVNAEASPADILASLLDDRAPGRRSGLDYLGTERAEMLAAQLVDALRPMLPAPSEAQFQGSWFAICTQVDRMGVILPLEEMDLCTPEVTAKVVRFVLDNVQHAITRARGAPWPQGGGVAYAVLQGGDEIRAGYGDACAPALELRPLFSP